MKTMSTADSNVMTMTNHISIIKYSPVGINGCPHKQLTLKEVEV